MIITYNHTVIIFNYTNSLIIMFFAEIVYHPIPRVHRKYIVNKNNLYKNSRIIHKGFHKNIKEYKYIICTHYTRI